MSWGPPICIEHRLLCKVAVSLCFSAQYAVFCLSLHNNAIHVAACMHLCVSARLRSVRARHACVRLTRHEGAVFHKGEGAAGSSVLCITGLCGEISALALCSLVYVGSGRPLTTQWLTSRRACQCPVR
jgi:hypothetical protein